MSILDLVKTAAGAMMGAKGMDTTKLLGVVSQLMEQTGGMNQLAQKFESAGLGDVMKSWISQGQNLPINAEQISKVFGGQNLNQMAQNLNMSGTDLGATLSNLLPQVIDKLTPKGEVTSNNVSLTQLMEIGKSFLTKNT